MTAEDEIRIFGNINLYFIKNVALLKLNFKNILIKVYLFKNKY